MRRQSSGIEQLAEYVTKPALVSSAAHPRLPAAWHRIADGDDAGRMEYAFEIWAPFVAVLPSFLPAFARSLRDARCVSFGGALHVLYEVEIARERHIYVGSAPSSQLPASWQSEHRSLWSALDPLLQSFYATAHDGFVFLPGSAAGPLSREEMRLDVIIAEPVPTPGFMLLDGGGGASLAATAHAQALDGHIVHENGNVERSAGLWELLDAWMYVGITE